MNVIKDGGGAGVTQEDTLHEEGKAMKGGMQKRGKRSWNKKTVHLQFCCLISSSIKYKLMQDSTWNSKITKGLLLGPLSLFPQKVIFHIPWVNMPVCRQTVRLPDNSITLHVQ